MLSFIFCTAAHVTNLPNQESPDPEFTWAPKNSDDDLEDFRSISKDRLPAAEEFNEIKGEYDMNDVDFGNEDDGYYDFISIRNNKRSPNSVSIFFETHCKQLCYKTYQFQLLSRSFCISLLFPAFTHLVMFLLEKLTVNDC